MTNLIIICILLFVIFCNILLCFHIGSRFEPMFTIVDEDEEVNNYETSNLLNENTEDNYKSNIDKIRLNVKKHLVGEKVIRKKNVDDLSIDQINLINNIEE